MQLHLAAIFLALLVLAPTAAETPNAEPHVRGCFEYGEAFCKKRCTDDSGTCLEECKQHCLTPEEVRDFIKQQPKK